VTRLSTSEKRKRFYAKFPDAKRRERLRYYKQFQKNNKRKFKLWTDEEDEGITAKERPPDGKLSTRLQRSVEAIQMRRWYLKSHPKKKGKR
jgi:hypothetical protein